MLKFTDLFKVNKNKVKTTRRSLKQPSKKQPLKKQPSKRNQSQSFMTIFRNFKNQLQGFMTIFENFKNQSQRFMTIFENFINLGVTNRSKIKTLRYFRLMSSALARNTICNSKKEKKHE